MVVHVGNVPICEDNYPAAVQRDDSSTAGLNEERGGVGRARCGSCFGEGHPWQDCADTDCSRYQI